MKCCDCFHPFPGSSASEASSYGSLEEEDLKKAGFGVGGLNFAPPSPRRTTPKKPRPRPPTFGGGGGGGGGFDDDMATTWPRISPQGGSPGVGGAADPRFGGGGGGGSGGLREPKQPRGASDGLRRSATADNLASSLGSGINGLGGLGGLGGLAPPGGGGGGGGGRRALPRTQSTPNIFGGASSLAQALAGIVVQSSSRH